LVSSNSSKKQTKEFDIVLLGKNKIEATPILRFAMVKRLQVKNPKNPKNQNSRPKNSSKKFVRNICQKFKFSSQIFVKKICQKNLSHNLSQKFVTKIHHKMVWYTYHRYTLGDVILLLPRYTD
jgi:hypothetical protein